MSANDRGAKKNFDARGGTSRRHDQGVHLRDKKRAEILGKKRQNELPMASAATASPEANARPSIDGPPDSIWSYHEGTLSNDIPANIIPTCIEMLQSGNPRGTLQCILIICKRLSSDAGDILEHLGPSVMQLLLLHTQHEDPAVVKQAVWGLCLISSGSRVLARLFLDLHVVHHLNSQMFNFPKEVQYHALSALSNIASDSQETAEVVVAQGCFGTMSRLLMEAQQMDEFVGEVLWAMCNMIRNLEKRREDLIRPILEKLVELLNVYEHNIWTNALWLFSYISDNSQEGILWISQPQIYQVANLALKSQNPEEVMPAARIMGNLASGNVAATDVVVRTGAIDEFPRLLQSQRSMLRKEICWTISNILAGTLEQAEQLLRTGVLEHIIECLNPTTPDISKEALWCLINFTRTLPPKYIEVAVTRYDFIGHFTRSLRRNTRCHANVLSALNRIASVGMHLHPAQNGFEQMFNQASTLTEVEDFLYTTMNIAERNAAAALLSSLGCEDGFLDDELDDDDDDDLLIEDDYGLEEDPFSRDGPINL